MTWNITELEVIRWAEKHDLLHKFSEIQIKDLIGCIYDIENGVNSGNRDGIEHRLGDVLVHLIYLAASEDIDLTRCLKAATARLEAQDV